MRPELPSEFVPKVLIVEDELTIALDLEGSLEGLGFQVMGLARTARQALNMAEAGRPDLVLMDVRLPGPMDGIAAAALIRDRWGIPVVFLTANSTPEVIARAKDAIAYGYLTKPFRLEELNGTIRLALARHQLMQVLLREHTWFTTLLGSLSDGVIATDEEGYVRYLNSAAEALTGWTQQEAKGRAFEEVFPSMEHDGTSGDHRQLRKALETHVPVTKHKFCVTSKDGRMLSVEASATPIIEKGATLGAVTIFQDITQQERTEQVLRESEKLAIVGRLASSISHEINNPLEAITNLLYIVERELDPESSVLQYIQLANEELVRITHITTETLRFHRQTTRPTQVNLANVLDSVMTLHQGRIRNLQVSVDKQYRPCDPLMAFENEIRQVLANLVGNALDAMASCSERRLTLKVCNAKDWRSGRRGVRVSVSDTGIGMSPATMKRLFKPFFTTKASTGTGLGLWVSLGLVEKHKGRLQFRSTRIDKRHGTVFSCFLPLSTEHEVAEGPPQ